MNFAISSPSLALSCGAEEMKAAMEKVRPARIVAEFFFVLKMVGIRGPGICSQVALIATADA